MRVAIFILSLSMSILFLMPLASTAQGHISFVTQKLETGVVLLKDSLGQKTFLLLEDSRELVLIGAYDDAEKNMKLINFIRSHFPQQPIGKIVLLSNRSAGWNVVPLLRRVNSRIQVFVPTGFNKYRKEILSDAVKSEALFLSSQLDTSEYSFPAQEVKGSLVILFGGRKAEIQSVQGTWSNSAIVCFLPDSRTLVGFKYFENQLKLRRGQGSNIYKWNKDLASWRFRCPSRILGGDDLRIYTTYEFEKYQKELASILDSYTEAVLQGLTAEEFVSGYKKAPRDIKLENEKNTLFFLHQQMKKYGG